MKWIIYIGIIILLLNLIVNQERKSQKDSTNLEENDRKTNIVQEDTYFKNQLREEVKEYFISFQEPKVLDAYWQGNSFYLGVKPDGTKRDAYAEYVCMELNSGRYDGIYGKSDMIYIIIKNIDNYKTIGDCLCDMKKN